MYTGFGQVIGVLRKVDAVLHTGGEESGWLRDWFLFLPLGDSNECWVIACNRRSGAGLAKNMEQATSHARFLILSIGPVPAEFRLGGPCRLGLNTIVFASCRAML